MLVPIKDYMEHVVCYGDAQTGEVENKYKKQTTRMKLPIGGSLNIVRDGTETEIIRVSVTKFEVHSYPAVA